MLDTPLYLDVPEHFYPTSDSMILWTPVLVYTLAKTAHPWPSHQIGHKTLHLHHLKDISYT